MGSRPTLLIPISTGDCHSCRFFSSTEDGENYCAIYNKHWSDTDEDAEAGETTHPEFCKATLARIEEQ